MPKLSKVQEKKLLECTDCTYNDRESIDKLKRGGPWSNYGVKNFDEYLFASREAYYRNWFLLLAAVGLGGYTLYNYTNKKVDSKEKIGTRTSKKLETVS